MMRIMFILMDTDGDGTVSLQEFQAAHERIFRQWNSTRMVASHLRGDADLHAGRWRIHATAVAGRNARASDETRAPPSGLILFHR